MPGADRRVVRTATAPGRIRIIGGALRGSRLDVPALPGLRPTPDRLRETLFNWLIPWIDGARCLDLFAGTGALGVEALSRGAAETTFVERDAALAAALRANLARLKTTGDVVQASAPDWLQRSPRPFDIVFLDPPFDESLWLPALVALEHGWLAEHALIYVESPRTAAVLPPPPWQPWRETTAGAVRGALYRRGAG